MSRRQRFSSRRCAIPRLRAVEGNHLPVGAPNLYSRDCHPRAGLSQAREPRRAPLLEETQDRMEKFAFGAHRWRWSIHLAAIAARLAAGALSRGSADLSAGACPGDSTGRAPAWPRA